MRSLFASLLTVAALALSVNAYYVDEPANTMNVYARRSFDIDEGLQVRDAFAMADEDILTDMLHEARTLRHDARSAMAGESFHEEADYFANHEVRWAEAVEGSVEPDYFSNHEVGE